MKHLNSFSFKELLRFKLPIFLKFGLNKNITIGKHVRFYISSTIKGKVSISDFSRARKIIIKAGDVGVFIKKFCAIGDNVRFIATNHILTKANLQMDLQRRIFKERLGCSKGPIKVGNNVWIGDGAIILSGVTIGDGAVIGAGSIVTKDVPPFSIVVGCPAKVKKKRFSDKIIKDLLDIQWWNWEYSKIKKNRDFFTTDLTKVNNIKDLIK